LLQRCDKRDPIVAAQRAVEALEPALSAVGIAPEEQNVARAELSVSGVVERHDGPLAPHVWMGDAEKERVLVSGLRDRGPERDIREITTIENSRVPEEVLYAEAADSALHCHGSFPARDRGGSHQPSRHRVTHDRVKA
jgi:hypothetical protein